MIGSTCGGDSAMGEVPIKQIAEATRRLERYHFSLEQAPGIIFDGEINRAEQRQYIRSRGINGKFPQSEQVWIGERGYGRRLGWDHWLSLQGRPFPDYLHAALELLLSGKIAFIEREGPFLRLKLEARKIPLFENPEPLFRAVFERLNCHDEALFKEMVELGHDVALAAQLWISPEDFQIKKITVRVSSNRFNHVWSAFFGGPQADIPRLSREEMEAASGEAPTSALLFFRLERLGGWQQSNSHCPWARRSIKLIKNKDAAKAYAEIYHPDWDKAYNDDTSDVKAKYHHPIEIGAYYEDEKLMPPFYRTWFASDSHAADKDYYFPATDYWRDHHHYGGQELGLKWEWYFDFRGNVPTPTMPGKRYHSAKNWGYGGNKVPLSPNKVPLNRLTFTEAIKQYNRYSLDGKRCAYLILGHVVHLLQDQGNPDHANLVVHPASAMNEVEAYDIFKICLFLAAEVAGIVVTPGLLPAVMAGDIGALIAHSPLILVAGIVFGIAYAACKATVDANEVGYELLIGEKWDVEQRIGPAVDATGVLGQLLGSYDAFFNELHTTCIAARNQIAAQYPGFDLLDYPLGLGSAKMIPSIPGLDPDIDSTDAGQTTPFYQLTDIIVKNIICYGAGFIRRFYEIVNHPPYVERVMVVKAPPGQVPISFGQFNPAFYLPECAKAQVRYSARWDAANATDRTLTVDGKPLIPDHTAYAFIQFGPNLGPGKSKVVKQATLKLVGLAPNSQPVSIVVPLNEAVDANLGTYYWGSFQPTNPWGQSYELTMEIHAYDTTAHFSQRPQPERGDELDAHPEKIALVNPDNSPLYPFDGYQAGVDRNHALKIGLPILLDFLEVNQPITNATEVNLIKPSQTPLLSPTDDPGAIVYDNLTLHAVDDVDFFHVGFQTSGKDDKMGDGVVRDWHGSGLFLESHACRIEIQVEEESGACMSLHLYDSQTANVLNFPYTKGATLVRPQDNFPDRTFYFAVKNPDFALQGRLRYKLSVRYIPSGYSVHGRLLYKFWELSHGPWPPPPERAWVNILGDPPIEVRYYDLRQFVSDLKNFLPSIIEELGIENRAERQIELATQQLDLGQIAHSAGLWQDAEMLLTESSQVFRQAGLRAKEANALRSLKDVCMAQGRRDEADRIAKRLDLIG